MVGGGPSIERTQQQLREWPGDIWAINGAWGWCEDHGIDAWFCSIDPMPEQADLMRGATKLVIAEHSDPAVFATAQGDVRKVTGDLSGPTSAVAASVLALKHRYDGATFFGCESCYIGDHTHAYGTPALCPLYRVQCGGESYLVKLELILQAEQLAKVIRQFPDLFAEEGGCFLAALIEHDDYDITHGPRDVVEAAMNAQGAQH